MSLLGEELVRLRRCERELRLLVEQASRARLDHYGLSTGRSVAIESGRLDRLCELLRMRKPSR